MLPKGHPSGDKRPENGAPLPLAANGDTPDQGPPSGTQPTQLCGGGAGRDSDQPPSPWPSFISLSRDRELFHSPIQYLSRIIASHKSLRSVDETYSARLSPPGEGFLLFVYFLFSLRNGNMPLCIQGAGGGTYRQNRIPQRWMYFITTSTSFFLGGSLYLFNFLYTRGGGFSGWLQIKTGAK